MIILTEGHSNTHTAKTACSVIRYRSDAVIAVLDSTRQGMTTDDLLGVGGDTPVVGSLADAVDANTLLIGIAPPGGKIPPEWRAVVLEAIQRGMNVVSGLHDFVSDDPEFAAAAEQHGVTLTDVRKNSEKTIARRVGLNEDCLRILTVGHDCSVGKMVTSIEIANALQDRGCDAKFIATGQTGIMVAGEGIPIDCVVADFVSGACEKMILENQQHEILVVEGQGSLVHPSYSGVTLSLLHGSLPHGLVLCCEVGRETVTGIDHLPIPPLRQIKDMNELMAGIVFPCPVIGISVNSSKVPVQDAEAECERLRQEFGLPVCDVFRHGPDALVAAVLALQEERNE